MDKLWYIYTRGYYLVLERNDLSNHEKTWLICLLLNDRSQSEKTDSNYMTFWKVQCNGGHKNISSNLDIWGKGGMSRWRTGDFLRQ